MAPNLSLSYSSQNGEGYIGMGWRLNGLSQITRCPQTIAQDGAITGVNFSTTDRFCLDGQRLVAINGGTYGANGTQYSTEIESFLRIVSYGSVGGGPAYFLVTTKSGQVMEFGNTTTSQVTFTGISAIYAWAIDKVTDVSGNSMTVTYLNGGYGHAYPSQINYTSNATSSPVLAAYNQVNFSYATRSDVVPQYISGGLSQINGVLTDIITSAGGTQVSDYHFNYLGSEGSIPLSQLSSITLTGGTGGAASSLPATTMVWSSWSGTSTPPTGTFGYSSSSTGVSFDPTSMKVVSGDFNGDGKMDYAILAGTEKYVYLSNGDGTFTLYDSYYFGSTPQVTYTMSAVQVISGDFNGDGLADFAILSSTQKYIYI